MSKALLTIIIPTLNRSEFLIRLLNYFAHTNFKHCIAIGDSSDSFHVEETKEAIKKIGEKLEIVYREYPGLSCYAAQKQLIQSVDTRYIVGLADDDFLVPNGLDRCIDFLENHSDYIAAHGFGVIVSTLKSDELYGKDLIIDNYRQPIIENENAKERLLELLENYSVPVYSVHRTRAFRVMWSDKIEDYSFGELLPCCLSVILGKIKQLKCFYLVRQDHDKRYLSPDLYDWITNSRWQSSYKIFQDCLTEELSKQESIVLDEAKEVVKQGFWAYLGNAMVKKWQSRYAQNGSGLYSELRGLARRIPGLRSAWHKARSFMPGRNHEMSLEALLRPSSPYHDDFMPIYRALTSPPEA